jgi:hypothetical protein
MGNATPWECARACRGGGPVPEAGEMDDGRRGGARGGSPSRRRRRPFCLSLALFPSLSLSPHLLIRHRNGRHGCQLAHVGRFNAVRGRGGRGRDGGAATPIWADTHAAPRRPARGPPRGGGLAGGGGGPQAGRLAGEAGGEEHVVGGMAEMVARRPERTGECDLAFFRFFRAAARLPLFGETRARARPALSLSLTLVYLREHLPLAHPRPPPPVWQPPPCSLPPAGGAGRTSRRRRRRAHCRPRSTRGASCTRPPPRARPRPPGRRTCGGAGAAPAGPSWRR